MREGHFSGRGSVELVVIGLLAALVVVIAFPMLISIHHPTIESAGEESLVDEFPID